MPKNRTAKKEAAAGHVVGHEAFTVINAIEGIQLEPRVLELLKSFEERGLSAEERLRELRALSAKAGDRV